MYVCVPSARKCTPTWRMQDSPFLFLPNSSVLRVMSKLSGFGINLGVQRDRKRMREREGAMSISPLLTKTNCAFVSARQRNSCNSV